MNEVIERVKSGAKISVTDIKELVDSYDITQVVVTNEKGSEVVTLSVNRCEIYLEAIELYQAGAFYGTNNIYFAQDDINYCGWQDDEYSDHLTLNFYLSHDDMLCLTFMGERPAEDIEGWHEIDLDNMRQFMEDALHGTNGYSLTAVNISDGFALNISIYGGRAFIEDLDEKHPKLRVNFDGNSLELLVFEDDCNDFQTKEADTMKAIRIHPYGQPFTTVKLLYCKKPE